MADSHALHLVSVLFRSLAWVNDQLSPREEVAVGVEEVVLHERLGGRLWYEAWNIFRGRLGGDFGRYLTFLHISVKTRRLQRQCMVFSIKAILLVRGHEHSLIRVELLLVPESLIPLVLESKPYHKVRHWVGLLCLGNSGRDNLSRDDRGHVPPLDLVFG